MDDVAKVEEDNGKDTDKSGFNASPKTFAAKWGFVIWIDQVAEEQNCTWTEAKRLNIVEFLNTVNYISDKAEENKRQMNEWRAKNKSQNVRSKR